LQGGSAISRIPRLDVHSTSAAARRSGAGVTFGTIAVAWGLGIAAVPAAAQTGNPIPLIPPPAKDAPSTTVPAVAPPAPAALKPAAAERRAPGHAVVARQLIPPAPVLSPPPLAVLAAPPAEVLSSPLPPRPPLSLETRLLPLGATEPAAAPPKPAS
jgi:hypothetical protein